MKNFLSLGATPSPVEDVNIPFGEWLPDIGELDNPGALEALNVVPIPGGYKPWRSFDASNSFKVATAVRGGLLYYERDGTVAILAGAADGIYQRNGLAFTKRYNYAIDVTSQQWQFIQYGWSIVALPPGSAPLVTDVGGALTFYPLGGSPPIAYCGARIGDFLILGNLDGEPGPDPARQPNRIRWSGFNNIESPWVTDPATQADFNDMPAEGGAVLAITGREFGTIFQERCISRITYTGGQAVFDIQTVETERGAISTGSVVDLGSQVLFIAHDGIFMWNGVNAVPVSDNKVTSYFFRRLNYNAKRLIVGGVDPVNRCVFWAYPILDNTTLTEILIYSLVEQKFSRAEINVDHMFNAASLGITLEQLTAPLESYTTSFDSDIYRGNIPALGGFRTGDQAYGVFVGPPLEAVIDTGLYTAPNRGRVFVNGARPLVDASAAVVQVKTLTRDQLLGDPIVESAYVSQEITGECPIIDEGRFMRFRTKIPAGSEWTYARGIDISRRSVGVV